jgi:hypothetical protein
MAKRIIGIGSINGAALTLTQEATRASGHLTPEGVDGGRAARDLRRRITDCAAERARAIGKPVEVFASGRHSSWVVDVVTP